MRFTVLISGPAEAYLDRLDAASRRRFTRRFDELAEEPLRPPLSKPLSGRSGIRSSRVGEWRVLFGVDLAQRVVTIHRIAPRGEVYR